MRAYFARGKMSKIDNIFDEFDQRHGGYTNSGELSISEEWTNRIERLFIIAKLAELLLKVDDELVAKGNTPDIGPEVAKIYTLKDSLHRALDGLT